MESGKGIGGITRSGIYLCRGQNAYIERIGRFNRLVVEEGGEVLVGECCGLNDEGHGVPLMVLPMCLGIVDS